MGSYEMCAAKMCLKIFYSWCHTKKRNWVSQNTSYSHLLTIKHHFGPELGKWTPLSRDLGVFLDTLKRNDRALPSFGMAMTNVKRLVFVTHTSHLLRYHIIDKPGVLENNVLHACHHSYDLRRLSKYP